MAALTLAAVQQIAKKFFRPDSNVPSPRKVIRKAAELTKSNPALKLEIGSGLAPRKNGWVTLDLVGGADLYWDLMKPLPFPDNSIAMIYSSHVLEHFAYPDLLKLLKDCLRSLKPGGEFSACVPNAALFIKGYLDPAHFDKDLIGYKPAFISEMKMDLLNYIAYMDGHHKYMFDEENLVGILERAGFASVRLRKFDPTLDLPQRDSQSIYVSALKQKPEN